MTDKLNEALRNVETTYSELVEIANGITKRIFDPIDALVNQLQLNINALPVDSIRDYLLQLQLKAFEISEIKEKSALKANLAEALQKEKFAINFNGADGSAAVKEKLALISTSEEIVTETLYDLVANLFKTKLDSIHRLVDVLKSILMSRMQETKFMNIGSDNYIPGTTNGRVVLNEQV